jgi:hypothetical protein
MAWYLQSTKAEGLRFKIVKLDTHTGRATLMGDTGVPFERVLTDELMEKFGYRPIMVNEPKACVSS